MYNPYFYCCKRSLIIAHYATEWGTSLKVFTAFSHISVTSKTTAKAGIMLTLKAYTVHHQDYLSLEIDFNTRLRLMKTNGCLEVERAGSLLHAF